MTNSNLVGLHDRQVARPFAFYDPPCVSCGLPIGICEAELLDHQWLSADSHDDSHPVVEEIGRQRG
jgi:hypothetical protein